MFPLSTLTNDQAEAFVREYDAGVDDRYRRFAGALDIAGGPALVATPDGLRALWVWFRDEVATANRPGPFVRAGIDIQPEWWMLPEDEYSHEILFFAVGAAAWFEVLLADEFPFERVRETRQTSIELNGPVHLLDTRFRNVGAQAANGRRRDPERFVYFCNGLREERERLSLDQRGLLAPAAPPGSPSLSFDEPTFEKGEIGIEYDLTASSEWLAAFDRSLRAAPILERLIDHEEGQYLSGRFRGTEAEIRQAIETLWHDANPEA